MPLWVPFKPRDTVWAGMSRLVFLSAQLQADCDTESGRSAEQQIRKPEARLPVPEMPPLRLHAFGPSSLSYHTCEMLGDAVRAVTLSLLGDLCCCRQGPDACVLAGVWPRVWDGPWNTPARCPYLRSVGAWGLGRRRCCRRLSTLSIWLGGFRHTPQR